MRRHPLPRRAGESSVSIGNINIFTLGCQGVCGNLHGGNDTADILCFNKYISADRLLFDQACIRAAVISGCVSVIALLGPVDHAVTAELRGDAGIEGGALRVAILGAGITPGCCAVLRISITSFSQACLEDVISTKFFHTCVGAAIAADCISVVALLGPIDHAITAELRGDAGIKRGALRVAILGAGITVCGRTRLAIGITGLFQTRLNDLVAAKFFDACSGTSITIR